MKKVIAIVVVAILIIGSVIIFVKSRAKTDSAQEDQISELPLDKRPYVELIPSSDGHWVNLKISNIISSEAGIIEYRLCYDLPDGRNQCPGGAVTLSDERELEREILIGTESSGKYYYDEGVENAEFSVTYKTQQKKLIGRSSIAVKLQNGGTNLASSDGKFSFILEEDFEDVWFIIASTMGLPKEFSQTFSTGPYAIYTSSDQDISGKLNFSGNVYQFVNDNWQIVEDKNKVIVKGVFLASD